MKKIIITGLFTFVCYLIEAQNVGIGTTTPTASAMLDVNSTTKGALVPRMTTLQRNAIISPASGLLVFDTVEKTLYMFDGVNWLGFPALSDFQRPTNNFEYGPDIFQDTTLMGYSVSMWDQFAAIGAPYVKTNGVASGVVYIYKYVAGKWIYSATILSPVNTFAAFFGGAVNLKGNYLVVGATGFASAGNEVGAAYVYNFNGSSWVLTQTITGNNIGAKFGQTVAINQFGTDVAVSEPYATVNGNLGNCGKVRVYHKFSATLLVQQIIQDANPVANENFGSALALSASGNHIVVGAASKTVNGFAGNGYFGQFDRSSSTWTQTHTYTPPSEYNLQIGLSVDITDSHLIFSVGAKKEVHYQNLTAQGYSAIFPDPVNSISLDPVTEEPKVFSGNALYNFPNGSVINKLKTLSVDNGQALPSLIGSYNSKIVAGVPVLQNSNKLYLGAVYFYE